MTVRVGNATFDDHVSIEVFPGQWTDTFVYPISYKHGLPPWDYAEAVRLLAPTLQKLRKGGATLWVPVETAPDGKGLWFYRSVKESLAWDMPVPVAVTQGRATLPQIGDFTYSPRVLPFPAPGGSTNAETWNPGGLSVHAVICIQVLNRITVGFTAEIASLAGISKPTARQALHDLVGMGFVTRINGLQDIDSHVEKKRIQAKRPIENPDTYDDAPGQDEKYSYWRINRSGVSFALRSIGVPAYFNFTERKERKIKNGKHRRISRMWSAWIRQAWPRAEIWAAWSEAWIPSAYTNPDGLAWGTYNGFETLFWLEVDSGRDSGKHIMELTRKRFLKAVDYAEAMNIRTVFGFLGMPWTIESAKLAFVGVPDNMAVVAIDWNKFGDLPYPQWGRAVFE